MWWIAAIGAGLIAIGAFKLGQLWEADKRDEQALA